MNQEITQVAAARRRKALLLGTASALVMCAGLPSRGWAQLYTNYPSTYSGPVNYPINPTQTGPTASGYTTEVLKPVNSDTTLSATIANGIGGVSGAGTSAVTTANSYTASAGGNDTSNSVTGTTLPLPNVADNDPDGVVLLTDAENTATVATARIANSYLAQVLTVDNSSAVSNVTNNTMASSVALNQSTTTLSGQVPVNYTSNIDNYAGAASSINSFYDTGPNSYYSSYGSILATTAQYNTGSGEAAGSNAMVTESYAGELLTGAADTPVVLNTSPAVTGNTFSAGFTGNSATTALTISAGGAPNLTGSAALTNAQQNASDTGAGTNPSAIVKYSFIALGVLPGSGEDASIGLAGAAAVTGNTITATAIGNQAVGASGTTGNILTLAGGIGLVSTTDNQNNEVYFYGATPETYGQGDIVVDNLQSNLNAALDSEVKQSGIGAGILGPVSGTAAVSNNTITAQTVGSEAYNGLLALGQGSPGTGSPLNGEFALTSLQSNQGSPITATIYQAGALLLPGEITGGTATVNANTSTATATGNSVVNTISLNAGSLTTASGGQASTFGERNPITYNGGEDSYPTTSDFTAYADASLLSLQQNDASSPVLAINTNSLFGIGTEGLAAGAVSVTNNTSAALATGNAASSGLVLTAASVSQSAALVSAQSSYGSVTAYLIDPINGFGTLEGVEGNASIAVTGNLQRAIATGNNASSLLSVAASSIAVSNDAGPASVFYYNSHATFPFTSGTPADADDGDASNQTYAGFIAYNDQATTAPVAATVTFGNPYSADVLYVGGEGLSTSTATNSTNAIVAAARGSTATTQLTLAPTDSLALYVGDYEYPIATYSPFALVTSAQALTDGINVTAGIISDTSGEPPYLPSIYTQIHGGVSGSTVTMAGNQIETLAEGNDATNALTLSGTATVVGGIASLDNGIPLGLTIPLPSGGATTITADAAFTLQNMQNAGSGAVSSIQSGTGVETAIAGNILNSTVLIGGATPALGNTIAATATTNTASNTLTLGASNLSASSGLQNFQVSTGATLAALGTSAGSIPTPGSTNTVLAYATNTDSSGNFSGATQENEDTYVSYTGWLISYDPNSTEDGFTLGAGGHYYKDVTGYVFPNTMLVSAGDQTSFTNTIPASPGSPGSPGFVALLNGNVTGSTIGITNNTVNATATSNSATNTVAVTSSMSHSALTYDYGEDVPASGFTGPGSFLSPLYGGTVLADVALQNVQVVANGGGTSTAAANGSFWISNAAVAPVYTNAVLSVSDNTQQAVATGNLANNSLSLSPGITPADTTSVTASLLSVQAVTSTAPLPVSASSTMLISAPMAMTDSTLTLSGNSNTASAVANDVTNALTVTGTTSLPGYDPTQMASLGVDPVTHSFAAYGDYTLVNLQSVSSGSVTSTASTTLLNNDLYLDQATVAGSTVTVDSNTTVAQALGNRASNTLTLTAAGASGATAAVGNIQANGASITASATIDVTVGLGQSPGNQIGSTTNNSTYSITNNTTQALATGNQATNALNASPAAYGTAVTQPGGNVFGNSGIPSASATYAVLNYQTNSGPVTATVTGTSPALLPHTINTGEGGYVVALNGTGTGNVVNMSGNTVTAQAIGNRATNNIVLAALNTGTASTAIASSQVNTGAISASITNAQVGAFVPGGSTGRVANNQLTASAFGNVVNSSVVTH